MFYDVQFHIIRIEVVHKIKKTGQVRVDLRTEAPDSLRRELLL